MSSGDQPSGFDPWSNGSLGILRTVVAVTRERQVTVTAASVAYYSFNSLIPFSLFLLAGLSYFGHLEMVAETIGRVAGMAPEGVRRFVKQASGNATTRRRAVAIAVVVFVWSGLRLFRAVDGAFSRIYGTRKRVSVIERLVNAILAFLTVAVAIALLGIVGVTLTVIAGKQLSLLLGPVLLFLSFLGLFLPMYYLFPEPAVTLREVLPGALTAAVAWTLASVGFRFYAETTGSILLYGAAGAVLLILTWLYVGGLVLLVGAVLNAVLAGRVDADSDWVPSL